MPSSPPADVVHQVAAPAVVLDARGRIVASNAAWMASTPAAAREGVAVGDGTDYLDVVRRSAARGDGDAAAVGDLIEDLLAGRTTYGLVDYPCPSPVAHRWFRCTAIRLEGEHLLLVHTPTTPPRPGGRDPAAASDDLVHDLTRPVDTARGLVETVLKRGDQVDPATRDEALEAAHRQLDHALQVVADLRTLPPVDGGGDAAPHPIGLAEVVAEAAETIGVGCRAEGEVDVTVRCDPGHLERVLVNLFDNAAKYGRPPVRVVACRQGHRLRLEVSDEGEGIPSDVVSELFARRRRGASHRASDLPGTGLGLSIVRDLLRVNGATIVHRPELPGAGFVIDLPVAADG